MEAASRWETEAIRESRDRRRARPTVSQQRTTPLPDGDWRTLREASDGTGIPIGTLRKWCRRETVESYLESDGEQTLRMLEMGSVMRNAKAMGRDLAISESRQPTADSQQPEPEIAPAAGPVPSTPYSVPSTAGEASPTMIVPVDAWNKMLNQLGNLHEAGQQLAEARERAAKAETEAKFLRERLGELREAQEPRQSPVPVLPGDEVLSTQYSVPSTGDGVGPTPVPPTEGPGDGKRSDAGGQESVETTSFFRYVVRGWRGRKR